MAYLENEGTRVTDKFHREKFSLRKFKMEMVLASMELWGIVDNSEKTSPSKLKPKMLKEYKKHIKKAISIIGFNLEDN